MRRHLILVLFAASPLLLVALWQVSPWVAIGAMFVSHMLVLYPTLTPNSQWLGPVITRFSTSEKEVWLTIDDGPDAVTTPAFLDLLARYDAHATFFTVGRALRSERQLARSIIAAGHELANHSDSHPSGSFWCLGSRRIAAEIDRCDQSIRSIDRNRRPIFRAPVGMKNPFVHPLLRARQSHLVGWTVRGFDGISTEPAAAVRRIMAGAEPGAILVIHEGRSKGESKQSVAVLETLLAELKAAGYRCVIPPLEACLPPAER